MSRRLLVLGGAATASLALASNALGRTQLLVTGAMERGASATTVVQVRAETSDAAPSKGTIYLPSGYTANLGQTAGTQIRKRSLRDSRRCRGNCGPNCSKTNARNVHRLRRFH